MANLKHKISVVTVTYGNRWLFLSQVLKRVLQSDYVYQVIVVNNASAYNVQEHIKQLNTSRITVIEQAENTGSAAGYKAGIYYAHQHTDTDFIWLLDDDNLPDENTPGKLIATWAQLTHEPERTALYCLRPDRKTHISVAKGENPYRYYLVPDNFLGFNIFRIVYNQVKKLQDRLIKKGPYKTLSQIPYVPYGGLFLTRQLIDLIGYPDERFFLYVDDSEYTYRITQNNGRILLAPECIVTDIDKSVGISYQKKLFHSHLLDEWSFRTYYHVRNRIYFYNKVAVKHPWIFKLNKVIFMYWLKLLSILTSKAAEYKKLQTAVYDGLNNKLGKADDNKF